MGWFSSLFSSGGSNNMIGEAILSGIGSALGGSDSKGPTSKEAGIESRRDMLYTAGIEDFYKQRDRSEKRDAFKNYAGWGNLSLSNPAYRNTHVPNKSLPLPVTNASNNEFADYVNKTLNKGGR